MKPIRSASRGFTLVELLVVIMIVLVLAVLGFLGAKRFIENAKKTQALAQFRDLTVGLTMFETDYGKPPIPENKKYNGDDTVYGDPDPTYHNGVIVGVLAGEEGDYTSGRSGETYTVREMNPRMVSYITFPLAEKGKSGVGEDGNLYDPWGNEVIMAVNSFAARDKSITSFNGGMNDRRLYTWGLGEYNETKPRDQSFVFWSYGKDGLKGDGVTPPTKVTSLKKSDDVVSWY
ncbi:MAG: type II secretion system protein [Akkermansiaceae bacterium]|nr:type II secretion system protein [Akkermansiaceae bacterium]